MAFEPYDWTCPYCNRAQTVTESRYSLEEMRLRNSGSKLGALWASAESVVCANASCHQLWLRVSLSSEGSDALGNRRSGDEIQNWQLLPESSAKPQPDYISKALRDDYIEACRIASLSPKASATLARRCLQGMIRDFSGIKKDTLFKEIEALSAAVTAGKAPLGVTAESVEAIDHVRGIGNIGAHMEKDVNLIIEIESSEAEQLIDLIELLFKEWYVARHDRQRRLKALKATAKAKSAARKPKTAKPKSEAQESAESKSGGQESAASAGGT